MKRKRFWKVTLKTSQTVVGLEGQTGRSPRTTIYNVIASSRIKAEKLVYEDVGEEVDVEKCDAEASTLKAFKGLVDYVEEGYE